MGLKAKLISMVIEQAMDAVPDKAKAIADDVLDVLEENFADSTSVIAAVNFARKVADIPDDFGGDED